MRQTWFFEKIKRNKPLSMLIKRQRKNIQINKNRNENGDITTDVVGGFCPAWFLQQLSPKEITKRSTLTINWLA